MSSSWENVRVDGSNMRAYVSVPDDAKKVPAIVVVQGQTGVDDFIQFTRMVASEGFVGAAPDLYHRDPPDCKDDAPTRRMRLTDRTLIADVNATVDYLKSHPAVDSARIGIVGFCMGGRAVYLMSAVNPDLKAGVMYYGGDPFMPGATVRRRLSAPKISIARSWATSAKTIRIRRQRICANSTPR